MDRARSAGQSGGMIAPLRVPWALRRLARPHAAAIEAALGPPRPGTVLRRTGRPWLFLCFTNRCGSNFVAQLLASTGACNDAGEFFNAETVLEHASARGLPTLHAYVETLPKLVKRARVLAAKASIDQLLMLTDAGILDQLMPDAAFLLIERQDRVAQAISRVIAAQTGRWTSAHRGTEECGEPAYDRSAIAAEIDKIVLANAAFCSFFAANGIVPIHRSYEDILRSPQPMMDDIAQRLKLGVLRANPARVRLKRQATDINAVWKARFTADEPTMS